MLSNFEQDQVGDGGDSIKVKSKIKRRFDKMSLALIDVIEDFSLVHFVPLNVQDVQSMRNLIKQIDKTNGYLFHELETPYSSAELESGVNQLARETADESFLVTDVQEKYIKSSIPIERHLEEVRQEMNEQG